jgi:rhodanese-related sulfurtransferase
MTRRWTRLLVPGIALAFTACATPPAKPPVKENAVIAQAKPKYKKPPRMNGRGEVSSISLEDFFALQESGKALIYDARPGFFYGLGHIPGAINLPKNNCDEKIAARESEIKSALAAGKTIVVYCTSLTCPDARAVAMHLSGFGYPATIYSGGWDAWKEAGMPTE